MTIKRLGNEAHKIQEDKGRLAKNLMKARKRPTTVLNSQAAKPN
jgi:hypothetical protein